ncbi:MAG: IS4 family transposase, partial [Pseudoxanthomonas sp.]|nr:IS4 family transposase [Pseudoxanthomonas sp.]
EWAIPACIRISNGKLHNVNVLEMPVDAGAYYVMDRGYVDSARLYAMHQAGAFFVTRAKAGMDARRVYSDLLDRSTGRALRQSVASVGRHRP